MIIENSINVYTDGSSFSRPRTGGIGIRLVVINSSGQEEFQDVSPSGYAGATNNQMELYACIKGVQEAMRHPAFVGVSRIDIHTDSQYVVDNTGKAFFSWSRSGWRNDQGKPVENADLWKKLLHTVQKCPKRVEFNWVKGHAKNKHNKAADKLARQSGRNAFNSPMNVVKVRRKLSDNSVEPGCVPMQNQRISIRIITDEYLRLQRCCKYKYEIISKSSPYYGKIDVVFSDILLNAGHCYSIRFNDNQNNPMIMKMFRELPKRRK
ncbi:ribonuclease H [Chloroflexota bacterium]